MPVEIPTFDLVLYGIMVVMTLLGLFRGLSGELASLAGFATALVVGYFLYGPAKGFATSVGFTAERTLPAAVVVDVVLSILVFGLVRLTVKKFVSFCLGRVSDSVFGAVAGAFKGMALAAVVTGFATASGLVPENTVAGKAIQTHSVVARTLATWASAYIEGARGE